MKLYGIPGCGTVKKARVWLKQAGWKKLLKIGPYLEAITGHAEVMHQG
jgi:arsenate reductase-like glutaredoxin family protein